MAQVVLSQLIAPPCGLALLLLWAGLAHRAWLLLLQASRAGGAWLLLLREQASRAGLLRRAGCAGQVEGVGLADHSVQAPLLIGIPGQDGNKAKQGNCDGMVNLHAAKGVSG